MNNEEAIEVLAKIRRRFRLWAALFVLSIGISLVAVLMFIETIDLQFVIWSVALAGLSGISYLSAQSAISDFVNVGKQLNEGE